MFGLEYMTQFKKGFKKITRMPIADLVEVGGVISDLQKGTALADQHVDHSLSGNWADYRDCHVKPGLVLIYKIDSYTLKLARIASHSGFFAETRRLTSIGLMQCDCSIILESQTL
ncbi:MAG: mRNA interferase YafQ [Gammaproteobacteria bacterium]|jgi:mRNA interferase YafQ